MIYCIDRIYILAISMCVAALIPSISTASPVWGAGITAITIPMAMNAAVAASCESLKTLSLENTVIESASVVPASSVTAGYGAPATQVPATCRVHATVSHPGANDRIGIDVWMPVDSWNGRFVGVGGRVFGGGNPNAVGGPVSEGYAAATTDTGHSSMFSGSFVLDENGRLNWTMVRDFSYVGLHDLAVVGKSITTAFYGSIPKYSYWNGCSTGGRQGLTEAQRYPQDYSGILLSSPGVSAQKLIMAEFWPQLVMNEQKDFLPQCKFATFQVEAVKSCDTVGDGVADGVIGDPLQCKFDPKSLIGMTTPCGTITAQDAAVVEKILSGPRSTSGQFLWYGLTQGASFTGIAATSTQNGTTIGTPDIVSLDHIKFWLLQNPNWDWRTVTYAQYDQLFQQSLEQYTDVMGTETADLSGFKKEGGKLLIWHGLNDHLIFPQGTINYYNRVVQFMGSPDKTRDFARLFLAPGVGHCGGGPGPQPDKSFDTLVNWVEHGRAPATLSGVVRDSKGAITATRPICLYPQTAVYKGSGPKTLASSFVCRSTSKKK
jgi:hypothetical protein